jgi:hypothetical protein
MNKKLLPLAVTAAAVSMGASAQMYVNNDGLGEILIFPFYSAENGNVTNVNLVNTTAHGKAVKVRFIEGENSQEVLDFNLYMSPGDHFSMGVSATAEGGGQVVTNDNPCTVPQFSPGVPVAFRGTLFAGDKKTTPAAAAFDNTSIARSASGYIEVIEMGQLVNGVGLYNKTDGTASTAAANAMLAAITHDSTGKPKDCTLPVKAWSTAAGGVMGAWKKEAAPVADGGLGLERGRSYMARTWTGGGLYGYAGVVNANDATAFGEDAIAIDNAVATPAADGGWQLHYEPGDTDPDFADTGLATSSTVSNVNGVVTYDYTPSSVDAVSGLFQTDEVLNDYVTDTDILAQTDWILTFPTKTFYVNGQGATATVAAKPFYDLWDGQAACEYASLSPVDREESTPAPAPGSAPDFSPAPAGKDPEVYDLPLCTEVSIVQFGSASAVKSNNLAVGVADQLDAADGWASISFDPAQLSTAAAKKAHSTRLLGDNATALRGLPVTGFAVQTYGNSSLNGSGSVANYAMSNNHKTVVIQSGNATPL